MAERLKPWTVMFYLVAEPEDRLNDLVEAEVEAIVEAATRYASDLHVVIQVDFNGKRGISRFVAGGREINNSKELKLAEETSPGNLDTLRNFFSWASKQFPGSRHAVFFWGHSFGPGGMFLRPDGAIASPHSAADDPSLDTDSSTVLSVPALASALSVTTGRAAKRLDLVVFKDCFMNTLEVAYELAPVVDFQIGTQALIPLHKATAAPGIAPLPSVWPYDSIFASLASSKKARSPVRNAALGIVDSIGDFYAQKPNLGDKGADVPFALLDLRRLADVVKGIDAFVRTMKHSKTGILLRSKALQKCIGGDAALVDVLTMCNHFTHAKSLKDAVKPHVIKCRSLSDTCTGVSIFYCPPEIDSGSFVLTGVAQRRYDNLLLSVRSHWDDVAFESLQTTQPFFK